MKLVIATLSAILLLSMGIIFSSCNGQHTSRDVKSSMSTKVSVPSIGTYVSNLDSNIMIIYQAKNNDYWFGGSNLFRYDGHTLIRYTTADGLCAKRIRSIQEDELGNMYFDTGVGINKFDGQKFETLKLVDHFSAYNIWQLGPYDLWFEGNWNKNGVYRFDGTSLYHLEFPKHELEEIFYLNHPRGGYSPYEVYKTFKDSRGHVWFGTGTFGACRFDGNSITWISEVELTEMDEGPAPGVRAIVEDEDGNFWFSNNIRHKYKVDVNNSKDDIEALWYEVLPGIDISEEKDMRPYFMAIAEDKDRNMWMVTYLEGVYKYDGKSITHYPLINGEKSINLFSIYRDRQDNIWLGSHDGGALKFNGKIFEKFILK